MIKNFIDLESQEYQDLYNYYHSLPPSLSQDERIVLISAWLESNYSFPSNTLDTLSRYFVAMLSKEAAETTSSNSTQTPPGSIPGTCQDNLFLSVYDIEYLTFAIRSALSSTSDDVSLDLLRLLVTYAVFARANPHPNNWIKCDAKDKQTIFYLASCSKLSTKAQLNLTNALHLIYNLNMRVVGSNQPIPCYQMLWQVDQPPLVDTINDASASFLNSASSDNYLVAIGPQDPSTISNFVSSIIDTL